MHLPPKEQQRFLAATLRGYFQYFGLWDYTKPLMKIRYEIVRYWAWTLRRRGQCDRSTWERLGQRTWFTLPTPRVVHPTVQRARNRGARCGDSARRVLRGAKAQDGDRLRRENARLKRNPERAEKLIEIQGKVFELLRELYLGSTPEKPTPQRKPQSPI